MNNPRLRAVSHSFKRASSRRELPGVGHQQVSLAPRRLDARRRRGIVAELAAQLRDAAVDRTIEAVVVDAAHRAEYFIAAHELPRAMREQRQQFEFLRRERHGLAREPYFARGLAD